jgi:hypothetical protein
MSNEKSKSSWRGRAKAWIKKESVRDNLIVSAITAVGLLAISGLSALVLSITDTVDLGGSLPIGLFIGAIAATALASAVAGGFLTQVFYFRPRLKKAKESSGHSIERLRASLLYTLHVKALVEALLEGRKDINKDLLRYVAETIKQATGKDTCISICAVGEESLELVDAPHHNDIERQAFQVPQQQSGVIFMAGQTQPETGLLGVDDLSLAGAGNAAEDLKAMAKHGHRCLKLAIIEDGSSGGQKSLLALAKQPEAFSTEDLLYLEFIALILSLDQRLRSFREAEGEGNASLGS